jgi:hypothetical protein
MNTFIIVYNWPMLANISDILTRIGIHSGQQLHVWNGLSVFKGPGDQVSYANQIHEQMAGALFIVTAYNPSSSYGWMDKKIWDWIRSN